MTLGVLKLWVQVRDLSQSKRRARNETGSN